MKVSFKQVDALKQSIKFPIKLLIELKSIFTTTYFAQFAVFAFHEAPFISRNKI